MSKAYTRKCLSDARAMFMGCLSRVIESSPMLGRAAGFSERFHERVGERAMGVRREVGVRHHS